jgi:type I restriction-modification system DNA methylase subunit
VHEVARERAQSFLRPEHQARILKAYQAFADEPGFAAVATTAEVPEKDGNLSIPRYVRPVGNGAVDGGGQDLKTAWAAFAAGGWQSTHAGEREVKMALRKTLFKYKLHQDQELFGRAYGYVRMYY